jgi:L-aminopeptidase/D-esterase-like protein
MTSKRGTFAIAAVAAIGALGMTVDSHAQGDKRHGPRNSITDVPGIRVGVETRTDFPYRTGVTVVWAPQGATGGAFVPGGWPGSINTDVLQPGKRGQKIDVAFLTGGSYFGLATFDGIIRWLEDHGYGLVTGATPAETDPLVSGAVVYDLGRGGAFKARPTPDWGRAAMQAANEGKVKQGNVGAGTGTNSGGGIPLKGGQGSASQLLTSGVTVGVVVAVNAAGTPVNFSDCGLFGAAFEVQSEFKAYNYKTPTFDECVKVRPRPQNVVSASQSVVVAQATAAEYEEEHAHTTIGVVATDAILTVAQANLLAKAANEGHDLAVSPINLTGDGDAMFAMATGRVAVTDAQFQEILQAARETWARAIAHAALNAETTANPLTGAKRLSYCDTFPSACSKK